MPIDITCPHYFHIPPIRKESTGDCCHIIEDIFHEGKTEQLQQCPNHNCSFYSEGVKLCQKILGEK